MRIRNNNIFLDLSYCFFSISNLQLVIKDITIWSLLLSNLIVLYLAVWNRWPLLSIVWIYWIQSLGIGVIWSVRLLTVKQFADKAGYTFEPKTKNLRIKNAFILMFSYFSLHLLFALVLTEFGQLQNFAPVIIAGAIFLANHLFTFIYSKEWNFTVKIDYEKLIYYPYIRIMPLYATIITSGFINRFYHISFDSRLTLAIFLLIVTFADAAMYIIEKQRFSSIPPTNNIAQKSTA